jgi:subtilisin family serine protease
MTRSIFTAAAALPLACSAGLAQPDHRAARADALRANPALTQDPGSVLVKFKNTVDEGSRQQVRANANAREIERFDIVPGLEHLQVPDAARAIQALRESGAVEYAEPDYIVRTTIAANDFSYYWLWGLNNTGQMSGGVPNVDIDAPEAWDSFTGDPNFIVAVIDDGTNYSHPDLAPNIWTNTGEFPGNGIDDDGNGYVDDIHGWDFYDYDADPNTPGFHGTHTAGTIGAVGNNGTGVTGVVWRARIIPLRFIGPDGGYISDAISALQYATRKGAKLSNNSWGGGGYSQSMHDALNAARAQGHLFVAAAGNGGSDYIGDNNDSYPFYPASYTLDNVVSVAAVSSSGALASFSNYGSTSVDIAAPGVDIYSTSGTGYGWSSGTSMAAPHVTGVAALVWGRNPTWTYAQVRSRLLSTTRPLPSLSGRVATAGMVNAAAAIAVVNTAPSVAISSPANGTSMPQGSSVTFSGSATDPQDGSLTAGMTWTSSLQGYLGTGASFTRADLVLGTHTITASATDSGGLSGNAAVSVTVTDPVEPPVVTPPSAPMNVTTSVSNGAVTIRWTDTSATETGFEVQRQERVGNRYTNLTTVGTVGANATSATNTPGSGKFQYRVRSINSAGASSWSPWVNANVR